MTLLLLVFLISALVLQNELPRLRLHGCVIDSLPRDPRNSSLKRTNKGRQGATTPWKQTSLLLSHQSPHLHLTDPASSVISNKTSSVDAQREDTSSDALSLQSHAKAFHVEAEEVQTCRLGVRLRGLWYASLIHSPGWHSASSFIMNEGSCEMLFNIEKQSGAGRESVARGTNREHF